MKAHRKGALILRPGRPTVRYCIDCKQEIPTTEKHPWKEDME